MQRRSCFPAKSAGNIILPWFNWPSPRSKQGTATNSAESSLKQSLTCLLSNYHSAKPEPSQCQSIGAPLQSATRMGAKEAGVAKRRAIIARAVGELFRSLFLNNVIYTHCHLLCIPPNR